MGNYKIRLGQYGENLAADFLIRRGFKIISRNFQTVYGEIDLIAASGDIFLFVEVKTRTRNDFGFPELAVDRKKISHLIKASQIYLARQQISSAWQLDIISVEINKHRLTARIRRFENVSFHY
jgi:putative endonuclease